MDDLSRKFRSIDWKGLQKSARKMQASTASALKDMVMTDLENKVRAATSDTSWGASGSDLMQIAQGTFNREDYALIMSIVWQRLGSSRWRCVYKSLEVLRYLVMHGAARCTEEARAANHHIQTLQHFRFVDPKTRRDHGEGVRTRAKLVCDMLADESVLEEEREKSKELRAKLQGGIGGPGGRLGGLSSEDYQYGYGGSSRSSNEHVTTTSTGGAGNFKGYGDDGDGEGAGYDDVPSGLFAKSVVGQTGQGGVAAADVPDFLGDAPEEGNKDGGDGDDNDFDPRAGNVSQAPVGDDDLFGTLGLGDGDASVSASVPAHLAAGENDATGAGKPLPTSVLIQNLAQQQYQQQGQQLQLYQGNRDMNGYGVNGQVQDGMGSSNVNAGGVMALGNDFGLDTGAGVMGVGMGVNASNSSMSTNIPTRPLITTKKEKDPFADLVDSAKKTGVL